MNLQESERAKSGLSLVASSARIIDLQDKLRCWTRHLHIAQENGDSRQIRIGEARLRQLENQIGEGSPRH